MRFETQRLVLRRWDVEHDVGPYWAVCRDPEVMRFVGDGRVASRADTAAAIARYEAAWKRDGFGLFAVELRASDVFVGFAGLSVPEFLPEVLPAVEIGWRLGRPHWGHGYATEAGRSVLDLAFGPLGLDRVVGILQVGKRRVRACDAQARDAVRARDRARALGPAAAGVRGHPAGVAARRGTVSRAGRPRA